MRDPREIHPRASVAKMLGDYLREASVLVLVFGFLDRFDELQPHSVVFIVVLSTSLFMTGAVLERLRT